MTEQRLIDANALRKIFDAMHSIPGGTHLDHLVLLGIKEYIDEAPTIDAVPVVRCKDCKFYRKHWPETVSDNPMRCDHPDLTYDIECYDQWLDVGPEDYCSKGERREVEPDGEDHH